LPDRSIVYHVDQGDIFRVHQALGDKFCLSGGVPNYLLAFGTPDEVRRHCRRVIDGVARDGGYIMDASAIVQNDARVENIRAMTDATLECGAYSRGHATAASAAGGPRPKAEDAKPDAFVRRTVGRRPPGVCTPWPEMRAKLPRIQGDERLCQRIWERIDALGSMYVWWIAMAF
jgi:hypothetical protein